MKPSIAVIDYGLGNVRSVSKALALAGGDARVSSEIKQIENADGIVLPGVGAFGKGMDNLEKAGLIPIIRSRIEAGKPFLGICLGLQMLFSVSEEHGSSRGMDIIKGEVKLFKNDLKIPHMGWNRVKFKNRQEGGGGIFEGISDGSYFYFVHSYYCQASEEKIIRGSTDYGINFTSVIEDKNIFGVQFHPEKSGENGLKLLKNFVDIVYANNTGN